MSGTGVIITRRRLVGQWLQALVLSVSRMTRVRTRLLRIVIKSTQSEFPLKGGGVALCFLYNYVV